MYTTMWSYLWDLVDDGLEDEVEAVGVDEFLFPFGHAERHGAHHGATSQVGLVVAGSGDGQLQVVIGFAHAAWGCGALQASGHQ